MTTKAKATKDETNDETTKDEAKAPTLTVKPDNEGEVTDASEAHVKAVAPLAAKDDGGVDSIAVVDKTKVVEVRNLQNVTDLPEDIVKGFAAVEKGEFKKLLAANQQGSADKYLHELAEEHVNKLAKEQATLVKADVLVKNYIRTV